jgi:hypothetical protein
MKKHFNEAGTILGKGVYHTRGGNIDLNTSLGDVFSVFWMYGCVEADVEIDQETGTVVGDAGLILRTENGGASWIHQRGRRRAKDILRHLRKGMELWVQVNREENRPRGPS